MQPSDIPYIDSLNIEGRRVLLRADLNVPLGDGGVIRDERRISEVLPTIRYALEKGAKLIIMSHMGSPVGKPDPTLSLKPVARRLSELLAKEVPLISDPFSTAAEQQIMQLPPGSAVLLENLRFYPGEEKNDAQFTARLARLGEVYVNDAFGTAHRSHASVVGLPAHIREHAAGFLMQKELRFYQRALIEPKRPLCVVLGGSKVSTKLPVLQSLATKADKLIIGGAMANTFLAAQGIQVGRSKFEPELFPRVIALLATMARRDCKVYLPVDVIVGPSPTSRGLGRAVPAQEMPADAMALDIGPASSLLFKQVLQNAETIVWNGPMGAFENEDYAKGTTDMTEHIASTHALKVAGGGDTDAAIMQMELEHKFDFISSGGGAFLELLEGKELPAFKALRAR